MVILGSKGHAKEIIDIFDKSNYKGDIFLYDDISKDLSDKLYNCFPILKSFEELKKRFKIQSDFVLGTGNPTVRQLLCDIGEEAGGNLKSIISPYAKIGIRDVVLAKGLNIMHNVILTNSITIDKGCLLNANCSIHHDVKIGKFCEIAPYASVLGGVTIGNNCFIGAGAIVLPNIVIGKNVTIGAGSIVTKHIENDRTVWGVPAK